MPLFGLETVSRTDPVYKACLVVATAGGAIAGGATGSFIGPAGTVGGYLGGAAWGFSAGFLLCPYLAPPIKRKFELGELLTEQDVRSAADAMSKYARVSGGRDVLKLVAIARTYAARNGSAPACSDPTSTARKLLSA